MSTDRLYHLSNAYYGPTAIVQVDPSFDYLPLWDGPVSSNAALEWTIKPSPNDATVFNFCTIYHNAAYCLDIFNQDSSNRTLPVLASPAADAGQQWSLTPERDGYYKLSNQWTGSGWYLDTYSSSTHGAFMSQGDFQGHYWMFSSVNGGTEFVPASTSSVTGPIPTTTMVTFSSPPGGTAATVASPANTSTSSSNSGATLHTANVGPIVGGVIGGIVFLVIIIGAAMWLLTRRRRAKVAAAQPEGGAQPTPNQISRVEAADGQIYELGDGSIVRELATVPMEVKKKMERYA